MLLELPTLFLEVRGSDVYGSERAAAADGRQIVREMDLLLRSRLKVRTMEIGRRRMEGEDSLRGGLLKGVESVEGGREGWDGRCR